MCFDCVIRSNPADSKSGRAYRLRACAYLWCSVIQEHMLKGSINAIFHWSLRICAWALAQSPEVNITLLMTQGNSVGVIYLGVTDASLADRSVPCDKISHVGRLPFNSARRRFDWRAACVGQGVFVCVCWQWDNPREQLRFSLWSICSNRQCAYITFCWPQITASQ